MKKINFWVGIILGIILLVSFKQQDVSSVIQKILEDNKKEIMFASYAKDKVSNDELKNYAVLLMQEHEHMEDELTQIANESSVDLSNLNSVANNLPLDSLDLLNETQFDEWFKTKAIESHERSISYFKNVLGNETIDHPKLKAWMKSTLPNLNSHLVIAKGLNISK